MSVEVLDPRFAPVARGASPLTRLCTGAVWAEGPVWMAEDQSVLFSDIPNNRMLRWQAQAGMTVWRSPADFTNGHVRELSNGASSALLHASHGQRAIVRTLFDHTASGLQARPDEVVVSHYQGKRLNSPNDVVVKSDGSIWFTDPPYGILSNREGHQAPSEQAQNHVFCYSPLTGELHSVSEDVSPQFIDQPNGLAFSPDERVLYVSDTSAALRPPGQGHHHIVAFDVRPLNQLANPRVFAVISPGLPDGFRVDVHGFIYTSSLDSVQVYHPSGQRIGRIAMPEKVGNLCFGGPQGDELFICASTSLYHVRLNTRGATA
jgi:gluconolactonase